MPIITDEVIEYIDRSVLCWLATADADNGPNVSPKEMFMHYGGDVVLIAHLASPVSVRNIEANPNVCVGFVDVFVQKGFKLKGRARIVSKADPMFVAYSGQLADVFGDKWPIKAVIEVTVVSVSRVLAPSYVLFPETTEESQIAAALRTYGVRPAEG